MQWEEMEDGREKKEAPHSFPTADLNSSGNNGSQASGDGLSLGLGLMV